MRILVSLQKSQSIVSLDKHLGDRPRREGSGKMLGTRIAALRIGAGMNQMELAEKMEVSPSAIGMYEQGRREPSGAMLVRLGRLFGVTADYLLTGRPVCSKDEEAIERMAAAGAETALRRQNRRSAGFTPQELGLLLTTLVEDP